jgi:chemosensory pili system protein ChpB (putative protein-glutamate methylesterase)
MSEQLTRVVLLARPGEACGRLEDALREAGAEIAKVIDPTDGGPDEALAARPQAVLIALDPLVEDALDRYEPLLSDPAITVIFDEAELAAQREGWDAARWVRHLAAKLHRHDDVLPPGGESETDFQPSPGPLPPPRADDGGVDITGEALQHAAEVPRDEGFEIAAFAATAEDDFDGGTLDAIEAAPSPPSDEDEEDAELLSAEDMDWSAPSDFKELPLVDGDFGAAGGEDDPDPMPTRNDVPDGDQAPRHDATRHDAIGFDESLGSTLSLAEDDGPIAVPAPSSADGPQIDLEEIERRVAGLELADTDSYGHGPLRGAVLVEGGIGGPDAVRQLLGEIPESFPRPVLVRLHLDGGRYDRLVKQMERAATLPVALAEAGQPADAGTIYFLSPTITVARERGRLVFAEDADAAQSLYARLPANDSAVLFLSGSDPALVEIAMAQAPQGAMVAAQTPESCYDGVAASALVERGGGSGSPAELAGRLAERWPS